MGGLPPVWGVLGLSQLPFVPSRAGGRAGGSRLVAGKAGGLTRTGLCLGVLLLLPCSPYPGGGTDPAPQKGSAGAGHRRGTTSPIVSPWGGARWDGDVGYRDLVTPMLAGGGGKGPRRSRAVWAQGSGGGGVPSPGLSQALAKAIFARNKGVRVRPPPPRSLLPAALVGQGPGGARLRGRMQLVGARQKLPG